MTHTKIRPTMLKKFGTLSVLGLAALSLMPQSARADNDDYNDGFRIAQNDRRTTIRGTVQSDGNGNVFTLRTDNGRTVTVFSRNEPQRLSRGDQVEATGSLDRRTNRFTADRVRVTRNDNNNGDSQTLRGTVTDDQRARDGFTMRASDGRTYFVNTSRTNEPNLRRGQSVEVRGRIQGSNVRADNVRVISGSDNDYSTLTRGIVTDEQRGPSDFVIRADDGRTYLVHAQNSGRPNLERGQTVQIRGRVVNTTIYATNVRVVGGSNSDTVMTGRVTRDYSGRDFEMRADNGRSVTVRTRREPIRLSRGDRIEVRGDMQNGVFQADRVRVLRDNDDDNSGNRINFTATVQRGGSGDFTVRADNGRDYTVTNTNVSVGYGDRVKVSGFLNRGVVRAESVQVLDRNNSDNR